ncbi:inosose dehydratase 2 [Striga asiatica]|uniref:Inosose dehydratase 2 n=1 Tax=Striga asiatica TaxID=4170 RepID=A0A5A7QCZ1_STRAF|nr:inosose dehydratase 2 [Striga asiatica]
MAAALTSSCACVAGPKWQPHEHQSPAPRPVDGERGSRDGSSHLGVLGGGLGVRIGGGYDVGCGELRAREIQLWRCLGEPEVVRLGLVFSHISNNFVYQKFLNSVMFNQFGLILELALLHGIHDV